MFYEIFFLPDDTVMPSPVIIESPKSVNGSKGQNLTLTCVTATTGDGNVTILWKKDNEVSAY